MSAVRILRIRRWRLWRRKPAAPPPPLTTVAEALAKQRRALVAAHRALAELRISRRRLEIHVAREASRAADIVQAADQADGAQLQRAEQAMQHSRTRVRQLQDDLREVDEHETRLETTIVMVEERLAQLQRQYRAIEARQHAADATVAVGSSMTAAADAQRALSLADDEVADDLAAVGRDLRLLQAKQEALAELAKQRDAEDELEAMWRAQGPPPRAS